ncbi:MAG: aspartate aminotransferase family protein [Bacteroidia bacterium]
MEKLNPGLDAKSFRQQAHQFVDWMADYLENVDQYPVKSQVAPRDIFDQIPEHAPNEAESMEAIFKDFESIIMPGITHWQSPGFFAYFPANSSYPSVLAEMLTATLGAQCMSWDTSPAAAELEERMMDWLKAACGFPTSWTGVIQDTASTATLAAILSARERASSWNINLEGLQASPRYRIYASAETHSSIEKAIKIAGLGATNFVKVPVNDRFELDVEALANLVQKDREAGYTPLCVVATLGTTGVTAMDPVEAMAEFCEKEKLWLHIDAAYAGTALALPEYQHLVSGIEKADSLVFNPHKWMFTNFDCTAYFVKDAATLVRTFEILPEYLKTKARGVNHYRDWGIPLGRRFRALKLWFVLRSYGLDGLRARLRDHISYATWLEGQVVADDRFEMLAPRTLTLVCFRYFEPNKTEDELDEMNATLLEQLNASGKLYLTHTKVKGKYCLRVVTSGVHMQLSHIESAWKSITSHL